MGQFRIGAPFGDTGAKLRFRLALACGIGAAILGAIAAKSSTREFLVSKALDGWGDRVYSRLWFIGEETLAGAAQQGSRVIVERPGQSRRDAVELGNAGNPWVVALDGSYAAWISGHALVSCALPGGTPASIPLENTAPVRAFSILSDHSAAILFADATLVRWDLAAKRLVARRKLDVPEAEQGVAAGDYLTVMSHDSRLLMYHLKDNGELTLVEESRAPAPPFQLLIPTPGRTAMLTPGGVRIREETFNSPGKVGSLAFGHRDHVIVAGDFDGVMVLPQTEDPYKLADARPGSVVAASETRLAVSGPGGTALLELTSEKRFTKLERSLSYSCLALSLLAVMLTLSGFFTEAVFLNPEGRKKRDMDANTSRGLPDIPPELVKVCSAGETILWSGAGLSAQSGFPLRHNFIISLIQTAQVDQWLEPALAAKLVATVARGEAEQALNQVVAAVRGATGPLLQQFGLAYSRFAPLSTSHQALARLPLAAAVTTNYDSLLEHMGAHWAGNILTVSNDRHVLALERGQFFVLKLFGDLSIPSSVSLCRSEFEAAVAGRPKVVETFRRLYDSRTFFFVGCSLEGLLRDLKTLGVNKPLMRHHYALAGVSGKSWKNQADELSRRYGIDVLPVSDERIQAALPEFLHKFADDVEKVSQSIVVKRMEAAS